MAKVLGIGGVFFKAADPQAVRRLVRPRCWVWTGDGLGACNFLATQGRRPATGLEPFKSDTDHFQPSAQPFMVNLLVDDLDARTGERAGPKGSRCWGGRTTRRTASFAWIDGPRRA